METQENIGTLTIGTKETEKMKLEPKTVKIVDFKIEHIEKAKSDKVCFEVKHPDREETLGISAVSTLVDKQVITTGTWLNYDDDKLIVKNSSLSYLLNNLGAKNLNETKGKEIETELDEKGYLCFKAY